MNRRVVYSGIIFLLTFISIPSAVVASSLQPYNIQPISYGIESTTITWKTLVPSESRIEYGTSSSYGINVSDNALKTTHSLSLSGLRSGTTYHFRVGDNTGIMSDDNTFVVPYGFGVLTNNPLPAVSTIHANDIQSNGMRLKTVDLAWDRYETANGSYDSAYIADKKNEIQVLKNSGLQIILDIGIHYPPGWLFGIDGNTLFKNQFGDSYSPGEPGKNIANTVFNNSLRTQLSEYIHQVITELGTDFYAIRVGGLWYSELHYPIESYNGRHNSFWGYDDNAQGIAANRPAGISANPVPGWVPNAVRNGTFERGNDGNWLLSGTDSITSDSHRGGQAIAKVNPGAFTNMTSQEIEVVPGRTYSFSFWGKTSDPDTTTPACIQFVNQDDSELIFTCASSTSYSLVSGTITPASNLVRARLLTYGTESVTLTYDDISVGAQGYSYDDDHSDAQAFWEWYRNSLTNYQNWQIEQYRNAGFNGNLFIIYPGWGIRAEASTNWITDSLSYDLSYTTVGNTGSHLPSGEEWSHQISNLPVDNKLFAYTTWIDGLGTDSSGNRADWGPAKYLSYVATNNNRLLYGENTGWGDLVVLQRAFDYIQTYNYNGIIWFNEDQLYSGTYASITDYHTEASQLDSTSPFNTLIRINNDETSTTSRDVTLTLSATDNLSSSANLEMILSNEPSFTGAVYEPYSNTKHWRLSAGSGEKTIYVRFRDAQGNISLPMQASITVPASHSPTPTPTRTIPSSGNTKSNAPPPSQPGCSKEAPSSAPELFQIEVSAKSARLYFTPSGKPFSGYVISYGHTEGEELYGATITADQYEGVTEYMVNELKPDTTYWFKIRGAHGCAPGSWSQNIKAHTLNASIKGTKTVYANTSSSQTSCRLYTVKPGDSLWAIAAKLLNNGRLYAEIIANNIDKYTSLKTSTVIHAGWHLQYNSNDTCSST